MEGGHFQRIIGLAWGNRLGPDPSGLFGKTLQNTRDTRSVIYFTGKGMEAISYLDGGSTSESSVLPIPQQAKATNPTALVAMRPARTHRPLLGQTDETSGLQTPQ